MISKAVSEKKNFMKSALKSWQKGIQSEKISHEELSRVRKSAKFSELAFANYQSGKFWGNELS